MERLKQALVDLVNKLEELFGSAFKNNILQKIDDSAAKAKAEAKQEIEQQIKVLVDKQGVILQILGAEFEQEIIDSLTQVSDALVDDLINIVKKAI